MRRFLLSALVIILVLIVIGQGAVLAIFFLGPRSALDQPSDALIFITGLGTNILIPDQDKTRPNPEPNNPDTVRNIQRVYQSRCEVCHGVDGKGQTATGSRMLPRAGDLTSVSSQSKSDGALFWIIGNGLPHTGMPGWKDVLKENQIWQLVHYIRTLPQGIPTASPTASPTLAPSATLSPTFVVTSPTAPSDLVSSPTASPTLAASPTVSLPPPATSSPIGATNTITVLIQDYTYYADGLSNVATVPVGTRVVWKATDDDAHTVSSETTPRTLDSPTLLRGETYEFTFTEPGEYRYFCVPHPYMIGSIIVK